MNDINQIRTLLDRWYGGESSPGDETMLTDFFASAGELPPDLEADRALFAAMSEAAASFTAGVETEMARERRVAKPARWRRILWAASGAAACLLAVVAAYNYSGTQDIHGPSPKPLFAQSVLLSRPQSFSLLPAPSPPIVARSKGAHIRHLPERHHSPRRRLTPKLIPRPSSPPTTV